MRRCLSLPCPIRNAFVVVLSDSMLINSLKDEPLEHFLIFDASMSEFTVSQSRRLQVPQLPVGIECAGQDHCNVSACFPVLYIYS